METVDVFGLGVHTSIQVTGQDAAGAAEAIRHAWSRCLEPRGGEREAEPILVEVTDEVEGVQASAARPATRLRGPELAPLMPRLTQSVTAASIALQAGHYFMMHAGAVGDPDSGAVVAYAAAGGTGKTTLSLRLGRTWSYLTDETVAVDPEGFLVPYEKPLSVRPDTGPESVGPVVKQEISPDALGLRTWPRSVDGRLAALVLIARDGTLAQPRVEELDTVSAMLELAPETSSLSSLPSPLQRLARLLDGVAPVLRITYAEAADVEEIFANRLRARS